MKKLNVLLLSLLTFVASAFAGPFDAWSHFREITINTTADGGGANVSGSVTNYPVLVRLTDASAATGADVLTAALAAGADIRFTDGTGSVSLPYEIERWTASAAEIWVRVPSISGNANNTIRMYWGNAGASAASNGAAVFGADNGFVGVWHLGGVDATTDRPSSVAGAPAAVPRNFDLGAFGSVEGAIGAADKLGPTGVGANQGSVQTGGAYLELGRNAAFEPNNYDGFADFTTGFSWSQWVYLDAATNFERYLAMGIDSVSGDNNRFISLRNNTAGLGLRWGTTPINNATVYNTGEWVLLGASKTAGTSNVTAYLNGAAEATTASQGNLSNMARNFVYIGRAPDATGYLNAKVDEIRIGNVARSADWMKLDFETQKAGASAVALGESKLTPAFEYVAKEVTLEVGSLMTAIEPAGINVITAVTVEPALPAGLTLNSATGVISGTPAGNTARTEYIFTADLATPDVTIIDTIYIRTATPIAGLTYANTTFVLPLGADTTIAAPMYTGQVDSFTVSPALPEGLALNASTGAISGTAVGSSAAVNHTVTAHNPLGNSTQVLNIAVLPAPSGLSYAASSMVISAGLTGPIGINKPTVTGTIQSWSINPALPAGLSFDTETGWISGTPTAASVSTDYLVSATNISGSANTTVNITVLATEDLGTWANVKTLNLNTSASAAGVSTIQENFPALVRLTSAHAAIFAAAKADGSDIRFTLGDNTPLAYSVERFDNAGQKAEFWVLLPTVNASGITSIRIHYGNGAATSRADAGRVFGSHNDFEAVWHLGNGANGSIPRANAVLGGNPAIPAASVANLGTGFTPIEGAIGLADTLRNLANSATVADEDHFSLGSGYRFDDGTGTMSMWIRVPNANWPSGHFVHFMTLGAGGGLGNNIWFGRGQNNTTGNHFRMRTSNGSGEGTTWTVNNAIGPKGNWDNFTVTFHGPIGKDKTWYKNGVQIGNFTGTPGTDNINPVTRGTTYIGRSAWGDRNLRGAVDEVRVATVARSADWVKLEFANQKVGVIPLMDLAYDNTSYSFVEESPIAAIAAPTLVGTASSFSISPALPAGLSLNAATGEITGTPLDASANQAYTITAIGSGAWSTSTTINLAITSLPPSAISYGTNPVVYQVGVPATANIPTNSGTITSWSVNPALPSGLSLNTSTGVISGEPLTAAAEAVYEVTGTGPDGSSAANVTITVLAASEDFSTWSNNRNIILNTSASGSNVANTVTGFPVLVRLGQDEASIFSQAMAAGADVRFSKANGITRLPYEIVSWDAAANKAEIWVKVDSVHGNNSTQFIKMYWGKGGSVDSSNSPAVFGASNGFAAVWHMGGTSGNEVDATANAFVANAINAPADTVGMIGRSRNFNGTDQLFAVGGTAAGALNFEMTDNYTLSAWVYVADMPAVGNSGVGIVNKGDNQYTLATYDGAASPKYWEITTRGNNTYLQARSNGGLVTTANSHIGSWRNITGTYRGGAVGQAIAESLYIDGVLINTLAATNNNNTGRNTAFDVHIGALAGGTAPGSTFSRYFVGHIDELRLANATRSADWVRLDYESQKTHQSLTNIGLQAPTISYAATNINATAGLAISAQTPTIGGPVSSALTIDPALPAGLSLNTTTGEISGTPSAVYGPVTHTITAANAGGSSTDSIIITVVAPAVPAAPMIVSPTFDEINVPVPFTVSWNAVPAPVSSYRLQGSLDSLFADDDGLDTVVTDTFFVVDEAPYNSRLHLRVRATNVGGDGDWSATISFNTIVAPPIISYTPATVSFALSAPIAEVTVSSTGGPIDAFSIMPDLAASTGLTFNTTTGAITGTPTMLSAASDYTVIATGFGGSDTTVLNLAIVPAIPGAPTAVTGTPGNAQVSVAFTAPAFDGGAAITEYTVTAHPGGATGTGATSPVTVSGLTNGDSYKFTVTATNSAGTGAASDTSDAVVPRTTPDAPTAVAGLAGNAQVVVSWTAPVVDGGAEITGYTVTAAPGGANCTTDGLSCAVTGLDNGTAYTFTVTATNAAGIGAASVASAEVTPTPDPTPSSAPQAVMGTPGNGLVTVSWIAPVSDGGSAITSYTATAAPGGATCTTVDGTTTQCEISGLTNGTPYTFTVTATNGIGVSAASAASDDVTPRTLPGAPTAVVGTPGVSQVSVAFVAPVSNGGAAITAYTVTAHPGGATGTGSSSPIAVTGLTGGTPYKFTVTATNAAGVGPVSDTSDAVVPFTVPDAPTAVTAVAGNGNATVSFTAPAFNGGSAITSYIVTSSPGGVTATEGSSPIVVMGLTNGVAYTFTVQATNAAGSSAASSASTAVTPNAPPAIAYTPATVSYPAFVAITAATPASTGGPVTTYGIAPALPTGLELNTTTGAISGTPTATSAASDYTITATGPGGVGTTTLNLAVTSNPPVIAYTPSTASYTVGTAITSPVLSSTGGPVTSYAVSPALPTGLSLNTTTGAVTGTPTAAAVAAAYTVTATGLGGTGSTVLNITVLPGLPVISYTTPRSLIRGVADSLIVTSTGGLVASYAVSPALPAGLTLNTTTGRIGGTPTAAAAAANYTVTATNASGSATAVVNITVVDLTPVVSYTPSTDVFTVGVAANKLPTSTGGAVTAWGITPGLPSGLLFSPTTGSITGTPAVAVSASNYTVTASNAYGVTTTTLNLAVLPGMPVISYAGTPKTFIKGSADSLIVTSTGGAVASYSVAPALPAGLTLNTTTGRIGGSATAATAAANYTVTATNASGSVTATVSITVVDLTPVVSYAAVTDTFEVSIAVTKNSVSTGGAVTAWSVSPALPAGLVLNATTGAITGTPTATTAAANYRVIATNAYGADTVMLNITVVPSTSIMPGAYTFRVSGVEKPYTFILPGGVASTEKVTMRITDIYGRTVWTKVVTPGQTHAATEVSWNGRTTTGMLASAGMYVVRVSVLTDGKTTNYVQKSVTLKSR